MSNTFKNKKMDTKTITVVGILAAISAVLYFFPTFPIFPVYHWLEIDFADVPALLVSAITNPILGAAVVAIRTIAHLPASTTGGVGELSNFLISASFVFTAGILFRFFTGKKTPTFKKIVISMPISIIVQVVAAVLCNKYIMLRVFPIPGDPAEYLLAGVAPFNLIKTVISSSLFLVVYKLIIPKIKQYI